MLNPNDLLGYVLEGRYRLVNLLGRGAYGLVFEAEEMLDQEVVGSVAVKILKAEDDCQKELIRKEIVGAHAGWPRFAQIQWPPEPQREHRPRRPVLFRYCCR